MSLSLFAAETPKNISLVDGLSPVSSTLPGVAIDGYDPVAYFDQDKAVKGDAAYTCEHNNVTWHFSSAENRDRFLENPEKFSPQYGGYCAHSITSNKLVTSDPEVFSIRDDKLYLYTDVKLKKRDVKRSTISFNKSKSKRDNNWLTYQKDF